MIYLDNPQVMILWDQGTKCVHVEWRDFMFGEEYRAALDTLLKVMTDHRGHKLLSDSRKMKAIPQDDQEWLLKDWAPRSAKAGLKSSAVVLPKSTLGTMTLQRLVQVGAGLSRRFVSTDGVSYFETVDEAKKWLKSLP